MRSLFLALSILLLAGFWPSLSMPPPAQSAPVWKLTPTITAILTVESSGGVNCKEGADGEKGCFQILPATSTHLQCPTTGRTLIADAACALKWLARGKSLCLRWDWYARAHWYHAGKCMKFSDRPDGYDMDFARARFKFYMEAK